jgi:hypothetical protein
VLGMENRPIGNKLADEYFFDADYKGVLRVDKNRKGDKPMIYFVHITAHRECIPYRRCRPRQRLGKRENPKKDYYLALCVSADGTVGT